LATLGELLMQAGLNNCVILTGSGQFIAELVYLIIAIGIDILNIMHHVLAVKPVECGAEAVITSHDKPPDAGNTGFLAVF
jgi:hypothetical protein